MFVSVKDANGKQNHGACVAKTEHITVSTDKGSFSIWLSETNDLTISVPGCDTLTIQPVSHSSVTLVQNRK